MDREVDEGIGHTNIYKQNYTHKLSLARKNMDLKIAERGHEKDFPPKLRVKSVVKYKDDNLV